MGKRKKRANFLKQHYFNRRPNVIKTNIDIF